jgi:hypothetical protein
MKAFYDMLMKILGFDGPKQYVLNTILVAWDAIVGSIVCFLVCGV